MNYYNEIDERFAKLLNVGTSFDVIRREVGKEVKVILYFLSSLADSERVNELNVSLLLSDSKKYLKEQVKRAKNDKNYLPTLLTKDFNIRETGVGSWLTFEAIDNKNTFDLNELKNCYGIGGVDLSSVGDLTCASCLIKKDNQLYLSQMYFIPEERAKQHEEEDKVPYKIWSRSVQHLLQMLPLQALVLNY